MAGHELRVRSNIGRHADMAALSNFRALTTVHLSADSDFASCLNSNLTFLLRSEEVQWSRLKPVDSGTRIADNQDA